MSHDYPLCVTFLRYFMADVRAFAVPSGLVRGAGAAPFGLWYPIDVRRCFGFWQPVSVLRALSRLRAFW